MANATHAGASKPSGSSSAVLALLKLEASAREAASLEELRFFIASETRKLTRARQVFVYETARNGTIALKTISGLPVVDQSAPMVMAMEDFMASIAVDNDISRQLEFRLDAYAGRFQDFTSSYPFPYLFWFPFLSRKEQAIGGMLLSREMPWTESDCIVGKRLSQTFAHAMRELSGGPKLAVNLERSRLAGVISMLLLAILSLVPVSITALSPFEITPRDPQIVAAPLEGTVETVAVDPNMPVSAGDVLIQFSATALRSRLDVAEREQQVADARLKRATQLAFESERGRYELRIAMSDVELKTAERDYARDMFNRATVKANVNGIAVFSDKSELVGRPYKVGERIMRIANPENVKATIEVAVGDVSLVKAGARVKFFLDADPLRPREGEIVSVDYQARVRAGNQLTFHALASISDSRPMPRIGLRGTAQIYGEKVPLGFYLFRRPFAAVRQWAGL